MNFELLRTFQLSAEHTMRLTQALPPFLAEWRTDIFIFTPGSTVLPWSQWSCWPIPTAGIVASCKCLSGVLLQKQCSAGTLQSKPSAGLWAPGRYTCLVKLILRWHFSWSLLWAFLFSLCSDLALNEKYIGLHKTSSGKSPPTKIIKLLPASLILNQWTNEVIGWITGRGLSGFLIQLFFWSDSAVRADLKGTVETTHNLSC